MIRLAGQWLIRCAIGGVAIIGSTRAAAGQAPPGMARATHDQKTISPTNLEPETLRLLQATRESAAPLHDRRVAIASGYRRIGPDVPSMGQHWISPRLVVADSLDVRRPALLTYIEVDGKPVLTGVVHAVPLEPGQSPPAIFGNHAVWHEHNGTLDEEALLPDHHTAPSAAKGLRLAILHAWLWSPNPEGMFATDNWTIPFLRLGLAAPRERFPEGAARALSLLSGSQQYFLNLAGEGSGSLVSPILLVCAREAHRIIARSRAGDRILRADEIGQLSSAWNEAINAVAKASGPETARRMNGGRNP